MSVRRGEWNHCIGNIGIPGCGKSVNAAKRLLELQREHGCYVLVHDPEYAFPSKLPDGTSTGLVPHESIDSVRHRLKKDAGGIHAVRVVDALEVVAYGNELGLASLARTPGSKGPAAPVMVHVDEITNCRELGANYLGPTLQGAIVARRHRHCGLSWTVQSAALVHRQLLVQSTELYVFRVGSERDVKKLMADANFARNSAELAMNLPRFEYIRHTPSGFEASPSASAETRAPKRPPEKNED